MPRRPVVAAAPSDPGPAPDLPAPPPHCAGDLAVLRALIDERARLRNLQQEVACRADEVIAELGLMARAADLRMLATYLDLAGAEARSERRRWEPAGS